MKRKYIFVTGGVVSSLGKGTTAAVLATLLKARKYKVTLQKIDPYINVSAGTISPYEHGEVFVTEDGAETDLDIGHYERFSNINLTKLSNITAGAIYGSIIEKERKGEFLGKTIQVVPHITDEIKNRIRLLAEKDNAEITIVEIGGTVGDIESQPFLEAIRQFKKDVGSENTLYIHVSLAPYLGPGGELKTKPTQHSVKALREIGIQPDIILCRSKESLTEEMREKIALFCDVEKEAIIEGLDTENIYELPLIFEEEGFAKVAELKLSLNKRKPNLTQWQEIVRKIKEPVDEINIAIVGKYIHQREAYLSIEEALKHAAIYHQLKLNIKRIETEIIEKSTQSQLKNLFADIAGIVVAGGFDYGGIAGKIKAVEYVRCKNIPFLGVCSGLQCAIIEFARNICKWVDANSSEFDRNTTHPVIDLLPEQKNVEGMNVGAPMRLGAYPCRLSHNTLSYKAYNKDIIYERHRHRYEVNNQYRDKMEKKGLVIAGTSPDYRLVEIIELKDHPFFVATQFHPEFKSRPTNPSPLFVEFVKRCVK